MPAQQELPVQLKEVTTKLPVVPGVAAMVQGVEKVLPSFVPRISSALPCKRR